MRIPILAAAISIMFSTASAVLEIPNQQPKVGAAQWKQVLDNTWQGLINRNIDACRDKQIYRQNPDSPGGLICRPKSETPWDAVSEGIGYGMLLALYADDQTTFDKIYNAGKEFGLNFCQGWRKPANGGYTESGSATDADEDIALALIFAAKLAEKGRWQASGINYASDAQRGVDCVWGSLDDGRLCPGNGWCPGFNLGYFAPAWYRIFGDFSTDQNHNWQKAIDASYSLIESSASYDIGMVPDWNGGGGYNNYLGGGAFFKDAIRVLWRIANDYIWFDEPRAKAFLEKSLAFINSKGGPSAANFYQLEGENKGELVPAGDKWMQFNGENNPDTWRTRREHSHLTVGQWLTAAMAVGSDEDKIAWSSEMAKFYDWNNNVDFFGNAADPAGGIEDTLHNEMYFDQFLAWFGVSLMSGTWVNVAQLLDNPPVANEEGITDEPFKDSPSPIRPPTDSSNSDNPTDEPPKGNAPIISKSNMRFGIQINQSAGIVRLYSQNDSSWKIHSLQGKLLFSSNSRETTWNAGSFKGAIVVSAVSKHGGGERKFLIIH